MLSGPLLDPSRDAPFLFPKTCPSSFSVAETGSHGGTHWLKILKHASSYPPSCNRGNRDLLERGLVLGHMGSRQIQWFLTPCTTISHLACPVFNCLKIKLRPVALGPGIESQALALHPSFECYIALLRNLFSAYPEKLATTPGKESTWEGSHSHPS